MFQLRRFLKFLKVEWANEISLPADPNYDPIRISTEIIKETLEYFEKDVNYFQIKAAILLCCSSGMRATELYKLTEEDIILNQNKILIIHDPKNNHTTKTKRSRVSFVSEEAKQAIEKYLDYFNSHNSGLRTLFAQKTLTRKFSSAPMREGVSNGISM